MTSLCRRCSEPLTPQLRPGRVKIYCSRRCARLVANERFRRRNQELFGFSGTPIMAVCARCDTAFPAGRMNGAKYCSMECRHAAMRDMFSGVPNDKREKRLRLGRRDKAMYPDPTPAVEWCACGSLLNSRRRCWRCEHVGDTCPDRTRRLELPPASVAQ